MKNFLTAMTFMAVVILYEAELNVAAGTIGLFAFVFFSWATYKEESF
jgi:hypothetical protein